MIVLVGRGFDGEGAWEASPEREEMCGARRGTPRLASERISFGKFLRARLRRGVGWNRLRHARGRRYRSRCRTVHLQMVVARSVRFVQSASRERASRGESSPRSTRSLYPNGADTRIR